MVQAISKPPSCSSRAHPTYLPRSPTSRQASFFGNANAHVQLACDQLLALEEITSPELNPSGKFDAIGFSQGGQLLRAVVERCGGEGGLNVRHLITVGSQHVSSATP